MRYQVVSAEQESRGYAEGPQKTGGPRLSAALSLLFQNPEASEMRQGHGR